MNEHLEHHLLLIFLLVILICFDPYLCESIKTFVSQNHC